MSALEVVATIAVKASSVEAIRDALTTLAAATRQEQGCLRYDLFESAASPGTFVTLEEWRSQEDLDAHLRSEHVQAAFAAAEGHLADDVAIHPLRPVL